MATESVEPGSVERIKEVVRLLNLALGECVHLLDSAEHAIRQSGQDNEPVRRPN